MSTILKYAKFQELPHSSPLFNSDWLEPAIPVFAGYQPCTRDHSGLSTEHTLLPPPTLQGRHYYNTHFTNAKTKLRKVKIFAISYIEEVTILGFFETKPVPKFQAHCLSPKSYGYLIQYISGEKRGEGKKPPKHKLLKNKNKKISVTLQNRPTRSPALFRGSQKAEVIARPSKDLTSQTVR